MRIVALGDFHIGKTKLYLTEQAAIDIANCSPDIVVLLGDFGDDEKIGTVEGLIQAHKYFESSEALVVPILGNHDMQLEDGNHAQVPGTIVQAFKKFFKLDKVYNVLEFDNFRLFLISTENQPLDSQYYLQECYVSDEQFSWITDELNKRPDIPCIFFTHAPPVGSKLRTVPEVHVRATNAYLDQNTNPNRWIKLIQQYPQIVLWFCAHYHLSHIHSDSTSNRFGTTFFNVGVHGNVTRDGRRQSRVIDIFDNEVSVYTLDHELRQIEKKVDWHQNKSLGQLAQEKAEVLFNKENKTSLLNHCQHSNTVSNLKDIDLVYSQMISVSKSTIHPGGIIPLGRDRCLVSTKDGFLWYLNLVYETNLGTLHMGRSLAGAVITQDGLWRAWDNEIALCNPYNDDCFIRFESDNQKLTTLKISNPIVSIVQRSGEGVYVCSRNTLYEIISGENTNCGTDDLHISIVDYFADDIRRLAYYDENLYILMENGSVYRGKSNIEGSELIGENIIDLCLLQNNIAQLSQEGETTYILYNGRFGKWREPVNNEFKGSLPADNARIVFLDERYILINADGDVFLWDVLTKRTAKFDLSGKACTASSFIAGEKQILLYLGIAPENESDYSQIQVWKIMEKN